MSDRSPLIAVRACNGAGKTWHVCAKLAKRALAVPGSKHRVVGPTRAQVRETSALYLWQLLRPYLSRRSTYRPGTGWNLNNVIVLANGSEIQLSSYQDDPQAQEGRHDLDVIVLDEVPTPAHFWANKGRSRQLLLTFTVQTRVPPDWLKQEIEGGERSPIEGRHEHGSGWTQYVVPLARENVPFYSDEEYERKAGRFKGTEEEQRRVWAAWESATEDRVLGGWSDRYVLSQKQILAALRDPQGRLRVDQVRYGIDWGTGTGKQCQYLILVARRRFFVVHEWIGGGQTTPTDCAAAFRDAIRGWLGWPVGLHLMGRRGWGVYGDANSAGPMGGGASLNLVLERAILNLANADGHRFDELPFRVRVPNKQGWAKDAREVACNHAMLEGRWFVREGLHRAIRAYKQYEGGDRDPQKDPIDAQLYAVQDLLLETRAPSDTQVRR